MSANIQKHIRNSNSLEHVFPTMLVIGNRLSNTSEKQSFKKSKNEGKKGYLCFYFVCMFFVCHKKRYAPSLAHFLTGE